MSMVNSAGEFTFQTIILLANILYYLRHCPLLIRESLPPLPLPRWTSFPAGCWLPAMNFTTNLLPPLTIPYHCQLPAFTDSPCANSLPPLVCCQLGLIIITVTVQQMVGMVWLHIRPIWTFMRYLGGTAMGQHTAAFPCNFYALICELIFSFLLMLTDLVILFRTNTVVLTHAAWPHHQKQNLSAVYTCPVLVPIAVFTCNL